MTQAITEIIDSDGHIRELDEELYPYLEAKYPRESLRIYYLFPTLDGYRRAGGPGRYVGNQASHWLKFLDDAKISEAVLYPTAALGFGFARDPAWAVDLARAYNDYVHDHFLKASSRLKAVALLPVQDPQAAARELRRAVTELGMVGGVLPAVGLRRPYGDAAFDPLYQEAQALDTMLAVHGAPLQGLPLDFLDNLSAGGALAHPFSQMIQLTSMTYERVFHRFPRLKVAFLEAGCGWVPYLLERIDGRTGGLASDQVRNHPVYFHAELGEVSLPGAISALGDDRFLYATDFPHEPFDEITETLHHFLAREDLSQKSKQRILRDNIVAIYGMK